MGVVASVLTGDGEIPEQLVRVGSLKPLCEVDIGELTADDGRHVEGFELVQDTTELERLFVVGLELRKPLEPCRRGAIGALGFFPLCVKGLLGDGQYGLLHGFDS